MVRKQSKTSFRFLLALTLAWSGLCVAADPAFDTIDTVGTGNTIFKGISLNPSNTGNQFLVVGRSWTGIHYQGIFAGLDKTNGGAEPTFATNINVPGKVLKKLQSNVAYDNLCTAITAATMSSIDYYFVACRSMKSNGYYDVYIQKYKTDGTLDTSFGTSGTKTTGIGGDSTNGHAFVRAILFNPNTAPTSDDEIIIVGARGFYAPGYFKPFIAAYQADDGAASQSPAYTESSRLGSTNPGDGGTAVGVLLNGSDYYVAATETGGGSGYTKNKVHILKFSSALVESTGTPWNAAVDFSQFSSSLTEFVPATFKLINGRMIVAGGVRVENTAPYDCFIASVNTSNAPEITTFGTSSALGNASKGVSAFTHSSSPHDKDCMINDIIADPNGSSPSKDMIGVGAAYSGLNYDTLAVRTNNVGTLQSAFDGDGIATHGIGSSDEVLNGVTSFTSDTTYVYAVGRTLSAGRSGGLVTKIAITGGGFTTVPRITHLSPNRGLAGSQASPTVAVIYGTNFNAGNMSATINGTACTSVSSTSTTVNCTVPNKSAGTYDVVVTNTATSVTSTLRNGFTYVTKMTVGAVSPSTGSTGGGTEVEIAGTDFVEGTTVKFGSTSATNVQVLGPTRLRCTSPSGSGTASVTVTSPDGYAVNTSNNFTYSTFAVTGVSPANVSQTNSANTQITISGSGFAGTDTVDLGGTSCGSVSLSGNDLLCTPASRSPGYGTVTVRVKKASTYGSASLVNGFTYWNAPTVHTVSPAVGTSGTVITIRGNNFAPSPHVSVAVGASNCGSLVRDSITQIRCTVPSGSSTNNVVVTNFSGFTGTKTSGFTYVSAPTVSNTNPTSAHVAGGGIVTITGNNFYSGATVTLGGTTCGNPSVQSATTIHCTIPAHATGTASVEVTNEDGRTNTSNSLFTYNYSSSPTISALAPAAGPASTGVPVTITGTGFTSGQCTGGANGVYVNGSQHTASPTINSFTSMSFTTPTNLSSNATIKVKCNSSDSGNLTFTIQTNPSVTSITPSGGNITGGTPVTILGSNFTAGGSPTVAIGGSTCTVTGSSAYSISCTTSAHAAATSSVVVTRNSTGTLSSAFTYAARPTVSSVNPLYGGITGNTTVTITGTGFTTGSTVTFGNNACTSVGYTNSTTLTCVAPAQTSSGNVLVTVTNADGQSGSRAAYSYAMVGEWISAATGPTARTLHSTVWTGSRMIVWGGWNGSTPIYDSTNYLRTGSMYNPTTDSWTVMGTDNAPSGRIYHTAVWTGDEMLVWGGAVPTDIAVSTDPPYEGTNTGAKYDPLANYWYTLSTGSNVPTGRWGHSAIWDGTYMVVYGGRNASGVTGIGNTGARYNPATDDWTANTTSGAPTLSGHAAVWSGTVMIVFGGWNGSAISNSGGKYNPSTDTWSNLLSGAPTARINHRAVWDGYNMIIWGGTDSSGNYLSDGVKYHPLISPESADYWVTLSSTNAPSGRQNHGMWWNSTLGKVVIWGGEQLPSGSGAQERFTSSGAMFDPQNSTTPTQIYNSTGSWTVLNTLGAPTGRTGHSLIVGAGYIVVWGGLDTTGVVNSGGRMRPQ